MKNFQLLNKPSEVRDYVESLWQSDIFKQKTYKNKEIDRIVDAYCSKPRIVAEYSDFELERQNHHSWMNILPKRKYDNPVVHDLFNLHEMKHMAHQYRLNEDYHSWAARMIHEELQASLFTEALVYYNDPDLREQSYDGPIWVDGFKQEEKTFGYDSYVHILKKARYQASVKPKKGSKLEEKIRDYAINNRLWVNVWKERYGVIETVYSLWGNVLSVIELWLEENATNGVLFHAELEEFRKVML